MELDLSPVGRTFVVLGIVTVAIGLALIFADRVPFLGRLPGDVTLRGDRWAVYLPIATSIVLSVALTLALTLFAWFRR